MSNFPFIDNLKNPACDGLVLSTLWKTFAYVRFEGRKKFESHNPIISQTFDRSTQLAWWYIAVALEVVVYAKML